MKLFLRCVKHDQNVHINFIFVHMLDDSGYDKHFDYRKWKLNEGNLVVARGSKLSKLYWTKVLVTRDNLNVINMETSLWDRRLSHFSEKGGTFWPKRTCI